MDNYSERVDPSAFRAVVAHIISETAQAIGSLDLTASQVRLMESIERGDVVRLDYPARTVE